MFLEKQKTMYANVIKCLTVVIFIVCSSNFTPQNNSIEVTYKEENHIVLDYLGVIMKVDKKHKKDLVKLHLSLLAEQVNQIGVNRLGSFYLGKNMLKAYVVFIGQTASSVELGQHWAISNQSHFGKEDFKVFVIQVNRNISEITEIHFNNYDIGKTQAYFFTLIPGVELRESRWYIVRSEMSAHSVMVKSGSDEVWRYRMVDKMHEPFGEKGKMPWHWNGNLTTHLQFYLEIFTNQTCIRTRIYIIDTFDVYTTEKNDIVLTYVAKDEYCKLISFETCPIFNVTVTYNYIELDCYFSYQISEVGDDSYPCQLKMTIQGFLMTIDSPLFIHYENISHVKLTDQKKAYLTMVIVMLALLSLAVIVYVCIKKKENS